MVEGKRSGGGRIRNRKKEREKNKKKRAKTKGRVPPCPLRWARPLDLVGRRIGPRMAKRGYCALMMRIWHFGLNHLSPSENE